ncbi:hypothetical protein [Planomicrobium sp. CPCC 101079]|uniref:hypothetical protein n=1 Tax=Planomicrobium sp. CPCC 101079 TaxID=2599618 RepID=UPI0011B6979A|nr:hypothetical protein [Planomicrobium sp. CPCC 101079]TWT14351.1 hypothetical protein FQV28_01770 [Planomicrobium sp. CPCC 101079]
MENYICETCGVQYDFSANEPEQCLICNEERQYVNPNGQSWTTLQAMVETGDFRNNFTQDEPGIYSIRTSPNFAIGQTAYLIHEDGYNMLWDCITLLDSPTIESVKELGGIQAIALSHPHHYSTQVEWAEVFDAPIYIHEDDRKWVTRPSEQLIFWSGETYEVHGGLVLHRLGGHFKGAAILQWKNSHLFTGDVVRVMADPSWASFMYSYPNFLPLPAKIVRRMAEQLKSVEFYRVYDAFHRTMRENANEQIQKSAQRYIDAINGELFST